MNLERVSLGIAAAAGPDIARRIAPAIEAAGMRGLWVNETPGHSALEVAAAAAEATERIVVATGVIAVDRRPANEIVAEVDRLRVPRERLVLGIGSGAARTGVLGLVRGALDDLRPVGAAGVVVGALGPRMRRLAAVRADGVLLNWLTPEHAAEQAREHREIDPDGRVTLYVRTATEPEAMTRLTEEARRYGRFPTYAANFARLGVDPLDTTIAPARLAERLPAYLNAVDEVVLRAIVPSDDADAYVRFVDAVAGAVAGA
ncbi:LLM class flavin-dependent oxidoreductase [Microbacterium album]|uniref:LLM class F420-dependent oxidoreductase n=1 Tax=Microbacterium album TaxID=2053191 RepID=A0A917MMZ0_9MICO|nr:LLM class flavin-dependent oxidoreductase [Microbacterium album]GGH37865.1 LLM class F420-dependent oxidoreductase [Microbacterium album]